MRHLGVDLAWGERARTGLAVLDDDGALVASAAVRGDSDIAAFVHRYCPTGVVAAVDAPLVVPNASGRRDCEAEVTRVFGRFAAGPYPSNRGNPLFVEPRASRLAARFGWSPDPGQRPDEDHSVCIEVYPHPAMVVLFSLDRVLPYKHKPGRDLEALRAAFLLLLSHVEATCGALLRLPDSTRWQQLRATVTAAARKSELRAVEDEVDAVFCSYLAWLWHRDPEALQVFGDLQRGYIVTPRTSGWNTQPTVPRPVCTATDGPTR